MDISAVGAAASGGTNPGTARLAETFDNFLTLLTTQLRNQDPLDPVDSNEFTQQLVLFSGVEQSINTNTKLQKLIALFETNQKANAVDYLDKVIEAQGDTTALSNGKAEWKYELLGAATSTSIMITNEQGGVVLSTNGGLGAGKHSFVWDGRDDQGFAQPDGLYRITVSANDINGQAIATTTAITGRVDAIELVDGGIVLSLGGVLIPIDRVNSIRQVTALSAGAGGDSTSTTP